MNSYKRAQVFFTYFLVHGNEMKILHLLIKREDLTVQQFYNHAMLIIILAQHTYRAQNKLICHFVLYYFLHSLSSITI